MFGDAAAYVMRVEGAVVCSGLLCCVMQWLYACHFEDVGF